MALHREMSIKNESPSPNATSEEWGSIANDFLSEESDFYGKTCLRSCSQLPLSWPSQVLRSGLGDPETVSTYNKLADSYDPQRYWEIHEWNTQVIAVKGRKAAKKRARELEKERARKNAKKLKLEELNEDKIGKIEDADDPLIQSDADRMDLDFIPPADEAIKSPEQRKPVNYYEGLPTAKQLSEPIAEFLDRLPPSTTPVSQGPWIWIANPYPPINARPDSGDIGGFKQAGFNLLQDYLTRKEEVEKKNVGKAPSTITRMLRPERLKLEPAIVTLAREKHVMNGKWMLFPTPSEVDRVWRTVAQATWEGKLGTSAKVATNAEGQEPPERAAQRLICIYTHDFSDEDDVKRVLLSMRQLGLLGDGGDQHPDAARAVYYKCDAYTLLDIGSGNEFKLKASMYNSRDLLKD
jgi:hypothetical protein